ncbi:MAG: lysine--tRNA ligase [Christensenellaceae bacterium]|jgi:lysyl-tRNA synthetase class 2|nr:lysine--tRNA ligase [Christensenellaceae bacterium]
MSNINDAPNTCEELDINDIVAMRREKLNILKESGNDPFQEVRYDRTAQACNILNSYSDYDGKTVKIAGRIMSKRIMGKASFAHIYDGTELIQLYAKVDLLGVDEYEAFKKLDIGDIIGVTGDVFTTHKGEISTKISNYILLAKSLLPLPEKYHGLKNTDLRYRQRYVDLIINPETKEVFIKRSKIITAIRRFLDDKGFIEVETPVLNTILGGANARPFVTHHNTLDLDMFLRIAPELYLKRLIVGGFQKVYELGRLFRNEGMSIKHNPEFTTMELYQAFADYNDMMDIVEELYKHCAKEVLGSEELDYQETKIDFKGSWHRVTMSELVKIHTDIDFYCDSLEIIKDKAIKMGLDVKDSYTWGKLMYELFDKYVEDKLIQPTFVIDYPVEVSPLAKRKKDDPRLTERFEFFIFGREMGNAFSELNDPIDQRHRFEEQGRAREAGDDEAQMMDEDFVTALEYGMPPTGGLGIGIDRMVMLFTDSSSIRDVLLFPTMKPKLN